MKSILLVLLLSVSAFGAITKDVDAYAIDSWYTKTIAVTPAAGSYVLISAGSYQQPVTSCSCTGATCTFDLIRRQSVNGDVYQEFWGMANAPSGITAVTCNFGGAVAFAMHVVSFAGVATTGSVISSGGSYNGSSATAAMPSLTTDCTEVLAVAGVESQPSSTVTTSVDNGFAQLTYTPTTNGRNVFNAYKVGAAGSYTTTFTFNSALEWTGNIVLLKGASATCSATSIPRRRLVAFQ